jgi:hypothetical protein
MGSEQLIWEVSFTQHMARGDAAVEAAHAANNAVLVYRGGPLGVRVPGAGEADPYARAMASALRDLKLNAQQAASGAPMGAGVLGQGELRGAGSVSELLRFPDLEVPKPLFKVGDRVLVSSDEPLMGPPFYDTVARMAGSSHVMLLGRRGIGVPVEHVKHAPEVGHDHC